MSDALLNLAKELKLNCVIDPQLVAGWKRSPAAATVHGSWTNITAAQAFIALLENYHLQISTNAKTGLARIHKR